MNSFEKHGLDDDAFEDKGLSGLRTFDAFRKFRLTLVEKVMRFSSTFVSSGKPHLTEEQPKRNQRTKQPLIEEGNGPSLSQLFA